MRVAFNLSLTLCLLFVGCGRESGSEAPDANRPSPSVEQRLTVEAPWIRPAPQGAVSALYLTLVNGTPRADTLQAVQFTGADSVEIHETRPMDDGSGMSGMREIGPLPVPPSSRIRLQPGGKHIMLMGLREALNVGDTLTVFLDFSDTGPRQLTAPVRTSPPGSDA
jgi:copper(I)-binding protein